MRSLGVVFFFLFLFTLITCDEKTPISTAPTTNPEIKVDFLFEHEGCRVYRFVDDGPPIYYANCGAHVQTSFEHACGKGCVQHVTVNTSQDKLQ